MAGNRNTITYTVTTVRSSTSLPIGARPCPRKYTLEHYKRLGIIHRPEYSVPCVPTNYVRTL